MTASIKTISKEALFEAITKQLAPAGVEIPVDVLEQIYNTHVMVCDNGGTITQTPIFGFSSGDTGFELVCNTYPSSKRTMFRLRSAETQLTVVRFEWGHVYSEEIDALNQPFTPVSEEPKEPAMKSTIKERIKNTYQNLRLKKLLAKLDDAETPMEAFSFLTQYLEEDTTLAGTIARKDTVVVYSFNFDKASKEIDAMVSIGNKVACEGCGKKHIVEDFFRMEMSLNEENIETFYHSVMSLANLAK